MGYKYKEAWLERIECDFKRIKIVCEQCEGVAELKTVRRPHFCKECGNDLWALKGIHVYKNDSFEFVELRSITKCMECFFKSEGEKAIGAVRERLLAPHFKKIQEEIENIRQKCGECGAFVFDDAEEFPEGDWVLIEVVEAVQKDRILREKFEAYLRQELEVCIRGGTDDYVFAIIFPEQRSKIKERAEVKKIWEDAPLALQ